MDAKQTKKGMIGRHFSLSQSQCLSIFFVVVVHCLVWIVNKLVYLFQVWFQNRRTKWRKKHAAEMATAKRKQEVLDNQTDENSDIISDNEEEHVSKKQTL